MCSQAVYQIIITNSPSPPRFLPAVSLSLNNLQLCNSDRSPDGLEQKQAEYPSDERHYEEADQKK